VFLLIGREYINNESCIRELRELMKKPKRFLERALVVKLDDISSGDFDIGLSTGRLRISEFWNQQMRYLGETIQAQPSGKNKRKRNVGTKNDLVQGLNEIVSDMPAILEFVADKARCTPYDHFVSYARLEELCKLLDREL
jgi:hypothetical protein